MYNKYNYQKYSVLSEHTRKDIPVKNAFQRSVNNDFFLL